MSKFPPDISPSVLATLFVVPSGSDGIQTFVLGVTSCGGSRHSAWGGQFNMFPSTHVYFFVGGGKSIVKLDGGHSRIPPSGCATPPGPFHHVPYEL